MKHPQTIGSRAWILSLAALTAVVALSVDMSLPAQPTLARELGASDATTQLTLSTFIVSFALVQLLTGFLADAWGRRRVLVGGLAVFVLASIACAAAPTIELLVACRILQGAGAAAAPVVARAMVRDTQPAANAARLLSTMLAVLAVAPMIAPSIGGALLLALGWRAIFGMLALLGVTFFALSAFTLPETLPAERRRALSPRSLAAGYWKFLTTPGTKLPMLIGCATFAGQFAYISVSPIVYMDGFRVSERVFGLYFGATALALMAGSLLGGRMIRAGRSPRAMIATGGVLLAIFGVAVALLAPHGIGGFLPAMIGFFFASGLSGPSAQALAMDPVPEVAGAASAAVGFSTMVSGAIAGYFAARFGGTSPIVFSRIALAMGLLACALALVTAASGRARRSSQTRSTRETR